MFINQYHAADRDKVSISAQQASCFAKQIAGDFNPIHDPDAQRFCVPGDLLFSLILGRYGLSQSMVFSFSGMVGHGVDLLFPDTESDRFELEDERGKTYLKVERSGGHSRDSGLIESFARDYVAFSGRNFPHILVPLMAEQGVMVNPVRPLVIYESMSFDLKHLDFGQPHLELSGTELDVQGKRGNALVHFEITAGGECVGSGSKKLVLSGLREYEHDGMQRLVDDYLARKTAYSD